jgi:hypothetical protein
LGLKKGLRGVKMGAMPGTGGMRTVSVAAAPTIAW